MSILEMVRAYIDGDAAAAMILAVAAKATVLLLLALVINAALRSASASLRHLVWSAAIGAVLLVPALAALVPEWTVPLPASMTLVAPSRQVVEGRAWEPTRLAPSERGVAAGRAGSPSVAVEPAGTAARPDAVAATPSAAVGVGRSADVAARPASPGGWNVWLVAVWLSGALVALSAIVLSLARTWLAGRRAARVESGRLVDRLQELSAALGLRRRVRLLLCGGRCMPMTWGVVRPVILLPRTAPAWPDARLRSVLLHELAHIKRFDFLTQLVARLACALHWFNPMAWLAARRLREEREMACDDQVLLSGSLASDYAELLLEMARSLSGQSPPATATVAMARRSQLGDRLRAVLDDGRTRRALSPRGALATCAAALLVALPLAAMAPTRSASARPALEPPADAARESVASVAAAVAEPGLAGERVGRWSAGDAVAEPAARATLCDWYASHNTSTSINVNDDDDWRVKISHDGCELKMELDGELVFNEDETEIVAVRGRGTAKIEEVRGGDSRKLELTGNGSRSLQRRWWVDGHERDFDDDARAWETDMIMVLFRRVGYQATERAERILARGGSEALQQEISQIPSDWTAGKYYAVLLAKGDLTPEELAAALRQAGREIESDYGLSRLLLAVAENRTMDAVVAAAYLEAAGSLDSDYETSRVLRALLANERLDDEMVVAVIGAAGTIGSDHEQGRVLASVSEDYELQGAVAASYLTAVGSIDSSYERRRALAALIDAGDLDPDVVRQLLESATDIDSDHELASLLIDLNDVYGIDDVTRAAFFRACDTLGSDHEQRRVLAAVVEGGAASDATLAAVLASARNLGSDYELGTLLIEIADDYTLNDELQDSFMRAADSIGSEYQRNRVLAALHPRGSGGRRY